MTLDGTSHGAGCDCCSGRRPTTPRPISNPPGQPALTYRAGTHATVKESILAGLSAQDVPALTGLGARDDDDATIALADGFAVMADILTFYQERIANEAYLRTATERRSVVELARLLGYEPDPGVAAEAWLAFVVQTSRTAPPQATAPVTVPAGSRVQSVPGPDESPQTFETVADIEARVTWNAIPAQTHRPWTVSAGQHEIVLAGTTHRLSPGDAVLVVGEERRTEHEGERWDVRLLREVVIDERFDLTRIRWAEGLGSEVPHTSPAADRVTVHVFRQRAALFGHNAPDPRLLSHTGTHLAELADLAAGTWHSFTLSGTEIDLDQPYRVAPGGWLALVGPLDKADDDRGAPAAGVRPAEEPSLPGYVELYGIQGVTFPSRSDFGLASKVTRVRLDTDEHLTRYNLRTTLVLAESEELPQAPVPLLAPVHGDRIPLRPTDGLRSGQPLAIRSAAAYVRVAPGAAGLALALADGTTRALTPGDRLEILAAPARAKADGTSVTLTPEELETAVADGSSESLHWQLADAAGRPGTLTAAPAAVTFDRAVDTDPRHAEVVHIAGTADAVTTGTDATTVRLERPLRRPYDRHSLRVSANVAPATHGETVGEIIGSGDAARANQVFPLKQSPVTHLATPTGSRPGLEVRVDGTLWTQRPTLYRADSRDRVYVVRTDDDGTSHVVFGDGREGARTPTGQANLRAVYRKGLGRAGNVRADSLTTLLIHPLGISEVTNPAQAEGGEDPELLADARSNAPTTVLTLGRAVSRSDYEDLARAVGGVTKAQATWVGSGPARGVVVTVAGPDGAAVEPGSVTHSRVLDTLRAAGDPLLPLHVVGHRPATFELAVRVVIDPAAEAATVLDGVRVALLDALGPAARSFGQHVLLDEVVTAVHRTSGVLAVEVDRLRRTDDAAAVPPVRPRLVAAAATVDGDDVVPAELLLLHPDALTAEASA